jgi:hypothetical protein
MAIFYELYFLIHKLVLIIIPYILNKIKIFQIIKINYLIAIKNTLLLLILIPITYIIDSNYIILFFIPFGILYLKIKKIIYIRFLILLIFSITSNYSFLHIILLSSFLSFFGIYFDIKISEKEEEIEISNDNIMYASQIFESKPKTRVKKFINPKNIIIKDNYF